MTTIAMNKSGVAFDSRMTMGNLIVSDSYMKAKEKDGYVFILSGRVASMDKFIETFFSDGDWEKWDAGGLVITPEGQVLIVEGDTGYFEWDGEFPYADGSGGSIALSAMKLGLSPVEAIEHTMTIDNCTGGEVHFIPFGELDDDGNIIEFEFEDEDSEPDFIVKADGTPFATEQSARRKLKEYPDYEVVECEEGGFMLIKE